MVDKCAAVDGNRAPVLACWQFLQGTRTLLLRMERHYENVLKMATFYKKINGWGILVWRMTPLIWLPPVSDHNPHTAPDRAAAHFRDTAELIRLSTGIENG